MLRNLPDVVTFRGVEFKVRPNCHVARGCYVCLECGTDLTSERSIQLHPKRHHLAWRCHRTLDGKPPEIYSPRSLPNVLLMSHGIEPAS